MEYDRMELSLLKIEVTGGILVNSHILNKAKRHIMKRNRFLRV